MVLDDGVHLSEGTKVRVTIVDVKANEEATIADDDPLLNMSDFAVDTGIPDLAVNIDHYLYGHPKVTDR
ncbi:MAG: hypothetical protein WD851_01580 [Pirellulales bacterium]